MISVDKFRAQKSILSKPLLRLVIDLVRRYNDVSIDISLYLAIKSFLAECVITPDSPPDSLFRATRRFRIRFGQLFHDLGAAESWDMAYLSSYDEIIDDMDTPSEKILLLLHSQIHQTHIDEIPHIIISTLRLESYP